jgi:hypothetical protein
LSKADWIWSRSPAAAGENEATEASTMASALVARRVKKPKNPRIILPLYPKAHWQTLNDD